MQSVFPSGKRPSGASGQGRDPRIFIKLALVLDINKIEDGEEVELKSAEDVLAEYKTDISIPQIQNTFKQYSEEFAKICGVSSIESIAGTVYEKLFLLSLKNISKIEQKPSPAVDARDLFSQIEKLAIEAGVVESKGKMFLGFFKSGGAKQKDVLLHLNGVDSGDNGCYYIDTEEFQDENNRIYRDWETDRKSTRLNSSHITRSRMPSSA